jgi:hypothetical protein
MSCGVLEAVYALIHQWLAHVGASLIAVDTYLRLTAQRTLDTVAAAASLLLSFESLVIVSFCAFLFLGGTLAILVLWPIIVETDDNDDCESGLYYADSDGDGRWVVPVILVDRNGRMNPGVVPTSTRRNHDRPRNKRH